jgi:hypothetical protein
LGAHGALAGTGRRRGEEVPRKGDKRRDDSGNNEHRSSHSSKDGNRDGNRDGSSDSSKDDSMRAGSVQPVLGRQW